MRKRLLLVFVGVILLVLMINVGYSEVKEPYVIGFQTDVTGPGNVNYAPVAEGFRLYMETLNDRGGIHGHPIKVVYEDDKSSPPRAGAIASKFILEDKVLAICGLSFSHAHPPVYELAKKHGVAVVVPFSSPAAVFSPVENDCQEVFATGPVMSSKFHYHGYGEALIISRLFPKDKTLASMSYATPGGRVLSSWGAKWSEKRGYKVVYHDDIPPGTVDISTWAQKVAKINPDILMASWGGEIIVPFWAAAEKMGWTNAVLFGNFITTADTIKAIERLIKPRNNLYFFSEIELPAPFGAVPIAEYDEMREAMKKYGSKFPLSARHGSGWITARVIEAALMKVGWPCDRSALLKALEKTNLDTKGLTGGPILFSSSDHYGPAYIKCYRWDPVKKSMITVMDWVRMDPKKIAKESE